MKNLKLILSVYFLFFTINAFAGKDDSVKDLKSFSTQEAMRECAKIYLEDKLSSTFQEIIGDRLERVEIDKEREYEMDDFVYFNGVLATEKPHMNISGKIYMYFRDYTSFSFMSKEKQHSSIVCAHTNNKEHKSGRSFCGYGLYIYDDNDDLLLEMFECFGTGLNFYSASFNGLMGELFESSDLFISEYDEYDPTDSNYIIRNMGKKMGKKDSSFNYFNTDYTDYNNYYEFKKGVSASCSQNSAQIICEESRSGFCGCNTVGKTTSSSDLFDFASGILGL